MKSHEIGDDNKKEREDLVRLEMIDGYREMGEENRRLAEESFFLVFEMFARIEYEED